MNNKLTTTNIGTSELKSLRQLAKKHNLTQVDYINKSILYFKKTGINPAEEITSPREEINKLNNKVESVIKFIRTQEKQKLNPLLDELITISRKLNDQIEDQLKSSEFNKQIKSIFEAQKEHTEKLNTITNPVEKLHNNIQTTHSLIFLIKELQENLYHSLSNRTTMGNFKKDDIKKFANTIKQFNNTYNYKS